jgi:hypothetical protein
MTTPGDVREAVAKCLIGNTIAGGSVFTPLDWQTWDGQYPVVIVRAPSTDRESLGRAQPQFNTTTTIEVVGRIEIDAPDDFTASLVAEKQTEALEDQIVRALIGYPPVMRALQQYPFVRSRMGFSAKGEQHLAEVVVEIGCEYYQGPEDFRPIPTVPLTDVRINDPAVFTAAQLPADLPGLQANIPLNNP